MHIVQVSEDWCIVMPHNHVENKQYLYHSVAPNFAPERKPLVWAKSALLEGFVEAWSFKSGTVSRWRILMFSLWAFYFCMKDRVQAGYAWQCSCLLTREGGFPIHFWEWVTCKPCYCLWDRDVFVRLSNLFHICPEVVDASHSSQHQVFVMHDQKSFHIRVLYKLLLQRSVSVFIHYSLMFTFKLIFGSALLFSKCKLQNSAMCYTCLGEWLLFSVTGIF